MIRVQGCAGVKLLECTNPVKDKWRVRWDVQEHDDGSADYMEAELDHKPTEDEIREIIISWYNSQIDTAILSGFTYDGAVVWLSQENQYNYKAAYDLAVQTGGATLPIKFKFGSADEPAYRTFETLDELADFYIAFFNYIQKTLNDGWEKKDAVDLSLYKT